ncbi:hypothetical protein PHABIO_115 [Pseudomonas phage Phabio]|uniref:Uncharacterized protein n=1 Tax=Pseudomonas phage Phabio TaxID=2006668 RepID=A0A1Y0SYM1_9CAUD|nr:hypothetical protein MZD05_gp115 [Pseudomonas phage Phabio]ARV76746.1 hypothetical protein PHABIO_115 [Pseudomonas phage Phabio]
MKHVIVSLIFIALTLWNFKTGTDKIKQLRSQYGRLPNSFYYFYIGFPSLFACFTVFVIYAEYQFYLGGN